jgi:hypothetical protein
VVKGVFVHLVRLGDTGGHGDVAWKHVRERKRIGLLR